MNVQQKIDSCTEKLQAILAGANERITAKSGTASADLDGLPDAIGSIPEGGGEAKLQAKSATPTGKTFAVKPDSGYDGLSAVRIAGDDFLAPENIADGITIYGVPGTYEGSRKILDILIRENTDTFTFAYEGGSTTGSAAFDADGLPIALTDDSGSTVNFVDGYPTSATDNNGNVVPIVWG